MFTNILYSHELCFALVIVSSNYALVDQIPLRLQIQLESVSSMCILIDNNKTTSDRAEEHTQHLQH